MIPITGRTKVYALLGSPVTQSPSPRIHNQWFQELGHDSVYVALPCNDPAGVTPSFRSLGLAGANVTIPLKEGAVVGADRLEPAAQMAGAANTLWYDSTKLVGANTDGEGFLQDLRADGIDLAGANVVIFGAGGAARGIAAALVDHQVARLTVLNRDPERAMRLVDGLARFAKTTDLRAGPLDANQLGGADAAIMTLPRAASETLSLDLTVLHDSALWCDIGYVLPEPRIFTQARSLGLRVRNGWGMLCWQAALAFQRWTGVLPDAERARSEQP